MRGSSLVYWGCLFTLAVGAGGCRITVVDDGFCGDAIVDPGEECDDGNNRNGDGCDSICLFELCGDAVLDPGEECDDGNNVSGDGCSRNCLIEGAAFCGDGIIDPGEECDDGNNFNGDGCSADCFIETAGFCGDGFIDPGEDCDDGNNFDGDGCSADCFEESTGYLICNGPGDCSGRDMCFDVTVPMDPPPGTDGSFCTHVCDNDGECMDANGFTGACYSISGSTSVCYQRCDMTSDCFVGNVCISVTLPGGTLDGVCVPDNAP